MVKEFCLSNKIFELSNIKINGELYTNYTKSGGSKFIRPEDVKEFIRKLKEEFDTIKNDNDRLWWNNFIDKLAGKQLW